jgi:ferric-dicitrate binding protein FerR (iron transport regulator)
LTCSAGARLTLGLLFAGFVALSARAVYLQVWQSDFLTNQGEKRAQRIAPLFPPIAA